MTTHPFIPHRRYPWFCDVCGYAPHERLQHGEPVDGTGRDPSPPVIRDAVPGTNPVKPLETLSNERHRGRP